MILKNHFFYTTQFLKTWLRTLLNLVGLQLAFTKNHRDGIWNLYIEFTKGSIQIAELLYLLFSIFVKMGISWSQANFHVCIKVYIYTQNQEYLVMVMNELNKIYLKNDSFS